MKVVARFGPCQTGVAINRYKKIMLAGWVFVWFVLGSVALSFAVFPTWWRAHAMRWRGWRGRHGRRVGPVAWMAIAGLVAMSLPVAMVWLWRGGRAGEAVAFDDAIAPADAQVAQLLEGERLVPPPPLPPEVFATVEVETLRPMLASADRRWDQMDVVFVQRLLRVFKLMKAQHGYDMALLEGYRSPERQAMLAARGPSVTSAGAWQSYHQYGLAADCAFYRDGKLVISERDPWAQRGYDLFGELAEQQGLTWGGRWKMRDLGHVEWRKEGVMRRGAEGHSL